MVLTERYDLIDKYIDKCITYDKNMNVLNIKLSKLYNYDELRNLIDTKMKNSIFQFNGITFLPQNNGRSYIFTEQNNNEENDICSNLLVKRLRTDVYNLYSLENSTSDNNIKRIGIAHIPTISCSHYCEKLFDNEDKQIIMKCYYDKNFGKWTPLEHLENTDTPDYTKDIELKIKNIVIY